MPQRTWSTAQRLPSVSETSQSPGSLQEARCTIRLRSVQTAEAVKNVARTYSMQTLCLRSRTMSDRARNSRIDQMTNDARDALSSAIDEMSNWSKGFLRQARRTASLDHDDMEKLVGDVDTAHGVLHRVLLAVFNFLKKVMIDIRDGLVALAKASKEFVSKVEDLVLRAISKLHQLFEGS